MDWENTKRQFQQRKEQLDAQTTNSVVETLMSQMNQSVKAFVNTAGANGTNPYNQANGALQQLINRQKDYARMNKDLGRAVAMLTDNGDIRSRLQQIGQLKQDIQNLEKDAEQAKQDASTSRSRQGSVERTRQDVSYYQGLSGGLGILKPLKATTVPILIGAGILCLFLSILMLKEFTKGDTETAAEVSGLLGGLSGPRFLAFGGGFVFTLLFVGAIAYFGYLGSKL